MKRRKFITHAGIAAASTLVPAFASACNKTMASNKGDLITSMNGRKLVVIQLSGGNDGLNTFVPFRNDIYYRSRPTLALDKKDILAVNDTIGFHPSLKPLRELYDQGIVSVINNVGYPNPNRSHFKSSDIWHSAIMPSAGTPDSGWLGRYLDAKHAGTNGLYKGIELEDSLDLIMKGKNKTAFTFSNADILKEFNDSKLTPYNINETTENSELQFLRTAIVETKSFASNIYDKIKKNRSVNVAPKTEFANKLKIVSELIKSEAPTDVYFLSLGGFDTHSNQLSRHEKVLSIYSEGIKYFMDELKANNLSKDTLVLTFSEFGRRVAQNNGKGTDHGKANNVILIADALKKQGFINELPDLGKLDKGGDIIYETDFRDIYATIIDNWLGASSNSILRGQFKKMDFV